MKIDYLLVCIYYGLFMSNQNNTIISSFLPQYSEEHFGINESMTGIIFATHSVGLFFASLITAKFMKNKGMKKKFFILGLVIQAFGQGAFLLLDIINNKYLYIFVSLLGRFIIGSGMAIYNVPAYSYIPVLYNENLEYMYGALEAIGGFGLAVGPVFGGFLFQYLGFYSSFIFCFVFTLAIIPLCIKFVPESANRLLKQRRKEKIFEIKKVNERKYISMQANKLEEKLIGNIKEDIGVLNHQIGDSSKESQIPQTLNNQESQDNLITLKDNNSEEQQHDDQEEGDNEDIGSDSDEQITMKINYMEILSNRYILTSYLVVVLQNAAYVYLDPTLAPYLATHFNKEPSFIGLLFFIQSGVYLLLCPLGSYLARKISSYKYLLAFGIFVSGLMGPDVQITHLPDDILMPILACGLIGFGTIFVYIPVLPDLNHSLGLLYPQIDNETTGDMSSALFNSSFALGSFIGPASTLFQLYLIFNKGGGFLVQWLGFPRSSAVLGMFLLGYDIIYLISGGVFTINKKTTSGQTRSKLHQVNEPTFTRPHRNVGSFHTSHINNRKSKAESFASDMDQFKRLGNNENSLIQSIISDHEVAFSYLNTKSNHVIVQKVVSTIKKKDQRQQSQSSDLKFQKHEHEGSKNKSDNLEYFQQK